MSLLFAVATLGLAIGAAGRLRLGRAASSTSTDVNWISELGIHYKLGVDGLNLFLILLTALLWVGGDGRLAAARRGSGRASTT